MLAHTLNYVIGEKGKTPILKFSDTQNSFTNFQSKESRVYPVQLVAPTI
jgi:hypothetical protein